MEKHELLSVIETFINVEEAHQGLDECLDSHSECIGTLRKYLLEGIREYVFTNDDLLKCSKTLKGIGSSLKGLCCTFGHLVFPLNGLAQLFYRLLTKIFTLELNIDANFDLNSCEQSELNNTGLFKQKHQILEMVDSCIFSLCTILKLLASENSSLYRDFLSETLKNINKLNVVLKNRDFKNNTKSDFQSYEIYSSLIQNLKNNSGWTIGNEAPITINFLKNNIWIQYLLGNITVNILKTQNSCFELSIIRDRFITSWIKILIKNIANFNSEILGMNLLIIKNITLSFEIGIDSSSLFYLINVNILNYLYTDKFIKDNGMNLQYFDNNVSLVELIGDFTIWYLDGVSSVSIKLKNTFFEKSNTLFVSQIEPVLVYWAKKFNLLSRDKITNYSVCKLYNLLEKLPFYSERININVIDRIYNELFKYDSINLEKVNDSSIKTRLFILLVKNRVNKELFNKELLSVDITSNILKNYFLKTSKSYSNERCELDLSFIITHIQLTFSKYFTKDILLEKNISIEIYYIVSTSLELIRFLLKEQIGYSFELGSYLLNHLCRIIDIEEKNITNWGLSQCLTISELSIRILSNSSNSTEQSIEVLLNLVGKNEVFSMIIWNCILNLLLINCINSNELEKKLLLSIFSKINTLENNKNLFPILIKILKPLSIMIMMDKDNEPLRFILKELYFLTKQMDNTDESYFPFGSSFESISYYQNIPFKLNSDFNKSPSFLSTIYKCSICETNITLIPSMDLQICNYCYSLIPTTIDIDSSIFIPELNGYLSVIDILLRFKRSKDFDDYLLEVLTNKILEVSKNVPLDNDNGFYDTLTIITSFCWDKSSRIRNLFLNLVKLGLSKNQKFLSYSHYQFLQLIFSKSFIWNNILSLCKNIRKANILTTEILIPTPLNILTIIDEIIDPKTLLCYNIENAIRLSLVFGSKIKNSTQDELEESFILQLFFGKIWNINELINYLSKINLIDIEYEQLNETIINFFSEFFTNKTKIQFTSEFPIFSAFLAIKLKIFTIMLISIGFTRSTYERFFYITLNILNKAISGIEQNWKKFWSKETFFEFSKGIIPIRKYSEECQSFFHGHSKVIYNILNILAAVIMKQNTTLSSISISPGSSKLISINLIKLIESKNKPQNLIISLIGPSFVYVLPNLFYKSLVECNLDTNLNILAYLRKFIPNSLSHERLVNQIPFFFFSVLDLASVLDHPNDNFNELSLHFQYLKKKFYLNLLQITKIDDLELPKTLINTCLAALLWSSTNPLYLIHFSVISTDFKDIINDFKIKFDLENFSYFIDRNKVFIQQYNWLANRIQVLINELNERKNFSPKHKKLKKDLLDQANVDIFFNVESYMCKNLIWLLEFYSKSIFAEKIHEISNNIQSVFFPVSFVVTEPPSCTKTSIYWFRVFRSISLLLYFSRKYIKKYATRLFELLIKLTHASSMHPSCIESWTIYIIHLIEDIQNKNVSQDIFLQLLSPIVDEIYLIIEFYISNNSPISTYVTDFFEFIVNRIIKTYPKYFVLIPIVPIKLGFSIKKILLKSYYLHKNLDISLNSEKEIDHEYYRLIFELFEQRIDLTLEFLSPNVPYITYEKLLGSIKDMLTLFPIRSYWALFGYGKIDNATFFRIYSLYHKCLKIISNTSNDLLIFFNKTNLETNSTKSCELYSISRFNIISMKFKENDIFSNLNLSRKFNCNSEKSISNLKNTIGVIIGSIGSMDHTIYSFLMSKTGINSDPSGENDEYHIRSINKSIFLKNLDTITVDLIQNHLITFSHWNVAAYAIQEALKYIGCHNSSIKINSSVWDKFQPNIQYLLHPYKSTEYRIIQGTKDHLLYQLKAINDRRTENVYEFYFWCIDKINDEINKLRTTENLVQTNVPESIKKINLLLEGCRLVSLGIPSVFNYILLISIECIVLLCDYSIVRELKEKLCSLVIFGLQNDASNESQKNLTLDYKNEKLNSSSIMINQVTYESIFIVMTHLMELYEYILQSKIPKFLPWFNESLIEPFLYQLYTNDNKNDISSELNEIHQTSADDNMTTPSSVTLSLLAEATKMENSKIVEESHSEKEQENEFLVTENEIENYIYRQSLNSNKKDSLLNQNDNSTRVHKSSNKTSKFFLKLSNYPIIKIIANLQFITDVPISILIQAALSCGTYTRAILLFERFLLTKQINVEFNKKKQRQISNKKKSLMKQFGISINYLGNAIDYFGSSGFSNLQFDPLDPLNFYKTCFNHFLDLPNIAGNEKRKIINHILYLPYQCYLGINDSDSLLGIIGIYERMSNISEGYIVKQLIEALLREDYIKAATIYERILSNNNFNTSILIIKNYLRCLLKAGLFQVVLSTLFNVRSIQKLNLKSENSINTEEFYLFHKNKHLFSNLNLSNSFVSEALEACYNLGNWEHLDFFLSDLNNFNDNYEYQKSSSDNLYIDLLIPSNDDLVMHKFDIYRGKLLLHLYYINKSNLAVQEYGGLNKIHESFFSTLERARNLIFTPLTTTCSEFHTKSLSSFEKLHILMDIEFIYNFLRSRIESKKIQDNYLINNFSFEEKKPEWLSISQLFINRVDNLQTSFDVKHSLLSQSKLTLEIAGFGLSSFSILLVLERSKLAILENSQSYINFLNSFEMIEIGYNSNNQNFSHTSRINSAFGLPESNINKILSLSSYGKDSIPGIIQLENSITLKYFEKILGKSVNNNNVNWTEIEKKLLDEYENENKHLSSLNQNLIVSYLFNLFQKNKITLGTHFYELLVTSRNFLDNSTLSEVNLVYLDWATKSSMISPENIINIFQKTLKYRSNCEKTYFKFANYLDNYFHLIISNIDDANISTNLNCVPNYHLGSLLQYDEIIFQCINMYLNCLKSGNSFVYPSLSRILFLIFNHSNIILKSNHLFTSKAENKEENYNMLSEPLNKIKTEIFSLPTALWYIVFPQLLSRSQHPGLGSLIIQPLIAKIIRFFPHQAAWYFVSMLKSNSVERKNTALNILKLSKSINNEFKNDFFIKECEYSSIIDEYIRLFDNLTILAMDMSTGTNISSFKDQKSTNRSSNKFMSLRTNFQAVYHSMKNIAKSRRLVIPIQKQLSLFSSFANSHKNILFSEMVPSLDKINSQSEKSFLSSYISLKNRSLHFPNLISISGMEDNIIILPSKQKPKKVGLIGSDGEVYYYLVKNEKRGDLRKDMRLMELAQLINQRMSIKGRELNLRTFSVIPLSEVAGIIEWVPNVTTLGNIVMNEWKELIGNSNFHRQLLETQDILRQNSMQKEKLYKLYCDEILPKYPPILHNWFFKKFSIKSSYIWLRAKQKYTNSTAIWSMFGYIVGLGDRHAENILIDTNSGDIIHVDFDCLFGKGFLLEIPEIVPFRLTPNIVVAMGSCGVEGTFTGSCISAMNIFRAPFNKSLIMTFLEAFVHDPLIEWMRPGKTSQITNLGISIDPVSFAAVAKGHSHLRTIYRKLNGMVDCFVQNKKNDIQEYSTKNCNSQRRTFHERGLGLSVESQVLELICSAKCKRNLSQMYAGWMPQL